MIFSQLDPLLLLLTYGSVIIFIAFFVRAMTGFGSALISIPLLALLFDLKIIVPLEAILEVSITLLLLRTIYYDIDRHTLIPMILGVALGSLLGVYGLTTVETPIIKRIFGVAIIGYALYLATNQRETVYQSAHGGWGFAAGFGGGVIGGTVGTSGPPYVMYLSYRLRDKRVLRATLTALFGMDGLWRIGLFTASGLLTTDVWWQAASLLPALTLGMFLGNRAHLNMSQQRFMQIVAAVLMVAGLLLLIG